jgi:hypothetical protein
VTLSKQKNGEQRRYRDRYTNEGSGDEGCVGGEKKRRVCSSEEKRRRRAGCRKEREVGRVRFRVKKESIESKKQPKLSWGIEGAQGV